VTKLKKQNMDGFQAAALDGTIVPLSRYKAKVLLIVNTASQCGFTQQYAGLEALYRQYKDKGFEVLAFPCNQFGAQEPGSATEIADFCRISYGISFPIFARIKVNGPDAHPLYRYLKSQKSGLLGLLGITRIKWNFTKFLLDREGNVVGRFGSSTTPAQLAVKVEALL
jgi:glutathione peroxidase